jgi:hypothetical protein
MKLAQQSLLERLARIDTAGRNLRPRLGVAALVEHEQFESSASLARDVCEHARPPRSHAGSLPKRS